MRKFAAVIEVGETVLLNPGLESSRKVWYIKGHAEDQ
jgi:hypothetical protein